MHPTKMTLDLNNPINCTSFKVRQFSRMLARLYDLEIADSGLKSSQYTLLTLILRRGPLTLGELAQRMGLSISTLSRNLKPLLDQGWVNRVSGNDARTRVVAITPEGKNKQAQTHQLWELAQSKINAKIGIERTLLLHAMIDACTATLQVVE
jgi:DNA-binding MarR family transcriptional regulator